MTTSRTWTRPAGALVLAGALTWGALAGPGSASLSNSKVKKIAKKAAAKETRGIINLGVGSQNWVDQTGGTQDQVTYFSSIARMSAPSASENNFSGISAGVPTTLYDERVEVLGSELCYDTRMNSTLTFVGLQVHRQTTSPSDVSPNPGGQDLTPRTGAECRFYALPSPFPLGPDDFVSLIVATAYSGSGEIDLGRVTFVLRATDTAASPASRTERTTTLSPA
jgi:hypothetical protein